jgi:hypothetical protein
VDLVARAAALDERFSQPAQREGSVQPVHLLHPDGAARHDVPWWPFD